MSVLMARIMFSGDDHFSSNNRGQHRNYPEEVIYYQKELMKIAKQYGVTHWVKAGDLTYGKFNDLTYRNRVDKLLLEQKELVRGNYWIIKGNHDSSSGGMTEYEYYLDKGYFKGKENFVLGNLSLSMLDYAKTKEQFEEQEVNIIAGKTNIILTHGYLSFEGTDLNLGKPIMIDKMEKWFGAKYIICGHIHQRFLLEGSIVKEDRASKCYIHYIPCLSRPSYFKQNNPTEGSIVLLDVFDDKCEYHEFPIKLLPLEESFDIEAIMAEEAHKEVTHIEISDIVANLQNHERTVGNPEDVIMAKTELPIEYREKAIELLKSAM